MFHFGNGSTMPHTTWAANSHRNEIVSPRSHEIEARAELALTHCGCEYYIFGTTTECYTGNRVPNEPIHRSPLSIGTDRLHSAFQLRPHTINAQRSWEQLVADRARNSCHVYLNWTILHLSPTAQLYLTKIHRNILTHWNRSPSHVYIELARVVGTPCNSESTSAEINARSHNDERSIECSILETWTAVILAHSALLRSIKILRSHSNRMFISGIFSIIPLWSSSDSCSTFMFEMKPIDIDGCINLRSGKRRRRRKNKLIDGNSYCCCCCSHFCSIHLPFFVLEFHIETKIKFKLFCLLDRINDERKRERQASNALVHEIEIQVFE